MNTSRSKAALFDVRATDSNHDIFHTADKTDTRRHSLTGRKHHAQCLLTKPYYVHSTKPIRLRTARTVSHTLRQTRGEGNTKRFKKDKRKNKQNKKPPRLTLRPTTSERTRKRNKTQTKETIERNSEDTTYKITN